MAEQVIIVGAGLAGLTAALHLANRGLHPLVLEADPRVGGRLRGGPIVQIEANGQTWDFPGEHGIHGVWGQYHNLRALLTAQHIDPGFVPSRMESWINRQPGGRLQWSEGGSALRHSWIPAPFHYLGLFVRPRFLQMLTLRDLASMFRVLAGLLLAVAFDPAVESVRLDKLTLADFFRGWSPTLQALFVGLARNFTSAPPDQVPQAGFIAFLRFYTLLRRDAWAFSYFNRDSDTALIAPLLRQLEAAGGRVCLGTPVTALERRDAGWHIEWEGGEADADRVIFAADVPGSRALLTQSAETAHWAASIKWPIAVPTVVLRFWFSRTPKRRAVKPEGGIFTGDFTLDNYFWLHRFQTAFIAWHQATGGSALECHIYGPPERLTEPDAVLFAKGLIDIQRVWPELRGTLIQQSIQRNPATHSLFSAGDTERYIGVTTPWSDLWMCGDWVRFPHPALYMERAVVTGIAAANGVLKANSLAEWPILPAERPELLTRGVERVLRWVRARARQYNQIRKRRPQA